MPGARANLVCIRAGPPHIWLTLVCGYPLLQSPTLFIKANLHTTRYSCVQLAVSYISASSTS